MDRAVLSRNFLPLEFKISEGVVFREQLKGRNRRLIVNSTGHTFQISRHCGGGICSHIFAYTFNRGQQ